MKQPTSQLKKELMTRRGFVLPMVIFVLMVMSVATIAAIMTSGDERLSSQAMRQSSLAFYAAEAGLHEVAAIWKDSVLTDMEPGDSVALNWRTLGSGSAYRGVIMRLDNGEGSQPLFMLSTEGRGPGAQAGQRVVNYVLTGGASGGNDAFMRAALVARGAIHMGADDRDYLGDIVTDPGFCGYGCRYNGQPWISAQDGAPPGWDAADCSDDPVSTAAIVVDDVNDIDLHPENDDLHQDPYPASESITDPIIEDPTIDNETFTQFGNLTRDSLIALADHVFPGWDGSERQMSFPSLNGDGTCNTDDPYNWGSDDPGHACYDYHPIIYFPDGAEIRPPYVPSDERDYEPCGYGQGILIANGPLKMGHLECEGDDPYKFAGIAIVTGCLELEYGTQFYGTAIVDDDMSGSAHADCDVSGDFPDNGVIANQNGTFNFSSCAINRALRANGLDESGSSLIPIGSRAFSDAIN
jgi:hypothetical protein